MKTLVKPIIAITIGDAAGIGPEIAIKALQDPAVYHLCNPVIVGDAKVIEFYADLFHLSLKINIIEDIGSARFTFGVLDIVHIGNIRLDRLHIGAGDAMTGKAMLEYTDRAIELALTEKVSAVIGGPHSKKAVESAGIEFDGYPGFIARRTHTKNAEVFLMLVSENLRIVNVTLHVSLRSALRMIKKELVLTAMRAANRAVKNLGVPHPRIAVAGLNPHAGEGGMFGDEEIEHINPAIAQAKHEGIDAHGAFGSDTLFLDLGRYDVFLAMYHDQAHIPIKLMAFNKITAMTIGTPVLFSTVGHGSAPDIAGKGIADPNSLITAIKLLSGMRR